MKKIFQRKIYKKIEQWKNKHDHILIIEGARQIGKSSVIEEFGRTHYENLIVMNFIETPELAKIFKENLNGERIIEEISLYFSQSINSQTLIFFDEIQNVKKLLLL